LALFFPFSSLILSSFSKIHCKVDPAKSYALQTSIWHSPASSIRLMTSSFTTNDKIFLFVFTETFFKHVFLRLWLINNYGQKNTNTQAETQLTPHCSTQSRQLNYCYVFRWFLPASSLRGMVIPPTQQAEL
jgi:hypothetical protein